MSEQMIRQTNFNMGEVDPTVWKRTDIPEYLTAAQSLLNIEVGTTGLARVHLYYLMQRVMLKPIRTCMNL